MANGIYSAGVYENVIDDTITADGDVTIVTAGIVVLAEKGPTEPTLITSNTQLLATYDIPKRDNPSLYSALRYLRRGAYLTVTRVVNDAVVAEGTLMADTEEVMTIKAANAGSWANDITVHFGAVLGEEDDIFAVVVRQNGEDVERFEVSRDPDSLDGYGRNRYIEDMINKRSKFIRIDDNPAYTDVLNFEEFVTLAGGLDDTVAPTDGMIAAAWEPYSKENEIDVEILINGGFVTKLVQEKMDEVAKKRTNTRAILDVPFDAKDSAAEMVAWRDELALDTQHSAMYGGWVKIYDQYTDREIFVPASGDVAAAYANTFKNHNYWDAPAGIKRATIQAIKPSLVFDRDERDLVYVNGINPVTTYGGVSVVIWGQKSLQRAKSALDRMNVVNNVKKITHTLKGLLHPYIFDANTRFMRDQVNYILTTYLEGILNREGLYAYAVDTESENTTDVIDNNQFIISVFIQPTRVAEMIRLNVTVSPTGVEFDVA